MDSRKSSRGYSAFDLTKYSGEFNTTNIKAARYKNEPRMEKDTRMKYYLRSMTKFFLTVNKANSDKVTHKILCPIMK
jgi:hypothetical protein